MKFSLLLFGMLKSYMYYLFFSLRWTSELSVFPYVSSNWKSFNCSRSLYKERTKYKKNKSNNSKKYISSIYLNFRCHENIDIISNILFFFATRGGSFRSFPFPLLFFPPLNDSAPSPSNTVRRRPLDY